METRDLRLQRAQQAIHSIGLGFDIHQDISFDNCKRGPRLIQINEEECRDLKIPTGISIPNVPNSIKCLGRESLRIQTQVYTVAQMSEHFNQEMRLAGNNPSGNFCASFGLSGYRATARSRVAYDGWFIRCYALELETLDKEPQDHVKEAVPSTWDPNALARFIERFGTHVIVGVSMGGKDVFYGRMEADEEFYNSGDQSGFLKFLKDKASLRFTDSPQLLCDHNQEIVVMYDRRGGRNEMMRHSEWLNTVDSEPDVISFFLLPLTNLLQGRGIRGIGFLTHAINLYIRYKPPIEVLYQFLDFQLPRQWAPLPDETSFGSRRMNRIETALRLSILGPMLFINTNPVEVGNRPVTGLRLQLEGRRSNRLAIHLQHLASLPKSLPLSDKESVHLSCDRSACNFHEKVNRRSPSYVCTSPVESDDGGSVVTGAQLLVERNCLRLRLRFSKVIGATLHKSPEWDHPSSSPIIDYYHQPMSRLWCCGLGHRINNKQDEPKPGEVTIRSSAGYIALPSPVNPRELGRFVNTAQIDRGPQNTPGYWLVSGAALFIHNGTIGLRVKYSLLNFLIE
ncbi:hypothetical protein VNO77_00695 [Canavalia gladiata]|uniref:MACPF domain-containing protein n=1 Tax=Canavalia gladiata TaxID=3824 RepID=A0AAN9R4A0_CANGL